MARRNRKRNPVQKRPVQTAAAVSAPEPVSAPVPVSPVRPAEFRKEEQIRWFDVVLLVLLALASHLLFQQVDILHTGGASFAYLNGHISDFYSYVASKIWSAMYMPTTYILFAIWNLPLKLLGIQTEVITHVPYGIQLWYSALPILAYALSALMIQRICQVAGFSRKKARIAAYAFASAPLAFFSQFIFGQYDSLTLFFMLLGTYYYLKNRTFRFVLFFSIAMTCKYYALLIFIPMLVLKEKKILRIILQAAGFMVPFVLETLFYLQDKKMLNDITRFNATGYIFNVSLDTGFRQSISLVILGFVAVCAWAFFTNPKDQTELFRWMIYFSSLVIFLTFGLSMWHPQWLILAVPYMVLGSMMHKRSDVFWILDLILMVCFVWFTVRFWQYELDQNLMRAGVLAPVIGERYNAALTMQDFYRINDVSMPFSIVSSILLVNALFKHPRFQVESPAQADKSYPGLLRTRFLIGVALFIVPALLCLNSMLRSPYAFSSWIQKAHSADWVLELREEGPEITQTFIPAKETVERLDLKMENHDVARKGQIRITLSDVTDAKTLGEYSLDMTQIRNAVKTTVTFDPVPLNMTHTYQWTLRAHPEEDGFTGIYYLPRNELEEQVYGWNACADGTEQEFYFAMDAFGR